MSEIPALTGPYGPFIHSGERNDRPRAFDYQARNVYALVLASSGRLTVTGQGSGMAEVLTPPAAVLLWPGLPQRVAATAGSRWACLRFDIMHVARCRRQRGAWVHSHDAPQPSPEQVWGVELPWCIPDHLVPSCRAMLELAITRYWRSPVQHLLANAWLGQWLLSLVEHALAAQGGQSAVEPEHAWTDESLAREARLGGTAASLARARGCSRQHFSRVFQQRFRISVREFLQRERMLHAADLLRGTSTSIAEVARECGYRSVPAFSHRFRERHGQSPAAWRRQQR